MLVVMTSAQPAKSHPIHLQSSNLINCPHYVFVHFLVFETNCVSTFESISNCAILSMYFSNSSTMKMYTCKQVESLNYFSTQSDYVL